MEISGEVEGWGEREGGGGERKEKRRGRERRDMLESGRRGRVRGRCAS